jgi:peptidoglycan/xylan/chitin deacetylase (PgdA/CDA1 family)
MPYFTYIPKWYQALRKDLVWSAPAAADEKTIYLSFDDGPVPGVSPWVLEVLKAHQAKATFFCIGDNAQKHPEILAQIQAEGHSIGNHTFHHLNGAKTNTQTYLKNYRQCAEVVPSKLFRPPYGRIKKEQARAITQAGSKIIMWDCLAADWDAMRSPEQSLQSLRRHIKPGSIVVFHDSIKAWPRLKVVLPKILEEYTKQAYVFKALSPEVL